MISWERFDSHLLCQLPFFLAPKIVFCLLRNLEHQHIICVCQADFFRFCKLLRAFFYFLFLCKQKRSQDSSAFEREGEREKTNCGKTFKSWIFLDKIWINGVQGRIFTNPLNDKPFFIIKAESLELQGWRNEVGKVEEIKSSCNRFLILSRDVTRRDEQHSW